jgi:hypothetical protein
MDKNLRREVFNKYDGRCSYCGLVIFIDKFQVDHLHPRANGGSNLIENLMPSCRKCNHYKSTLSLEHFRDQMNTLQRRIDKIYIVNVAVNFGIINYVPWSGVFYFENFPEPPKEKEE